MINAAKFEFYVQDSGKVKQCLTASVIKLVSVQVFRDLVGVNVSV